MTKMGKRFSPNLKYSNIKMHQSANKIQHQKSLKTGDILNKLSGAGKDKFFVDAKKHNKLGKDGFLKLLSAQLKNQDPLKPVDQKQFAADLAQFAQLEQLTNMNSKMQKNIDNKQFKEKFYGASFLGKTIVTNGTSINLQNDAVTLPFSLDKNASSIVIRIYDKKHQMIKQIEANAMPKGLNSIVWNGKSSDGYMANKGDYTFDVIGWDKEYNQFHGKTKSHGVVSGVSFEKGETLLHIKDGSIVNLRDVDSFMSTQETKDSFSKKNILTKNSQLKKKANEVYNKMDDVINF